VEEGADLVLDGRSLVVPGYEKGFFVGPTIFDNVSEDMTVGRDEIFARCSPSNGWRTSKRASPS